MDRWINDTSVIGFSAESNSYGARQLTAKEMNEVGYMYCEWSSGKGVKWMCIPCLKHILKIQPCQYSPVGIQVSLMKSNDLSREARITEICKKIFNDVNI